MSSITLSARLEKSKIALGKKHELHLLVNLEGAKLEGDRKPLALGVAIDVSGSMAGAKIEQAKRSLQKLIDHMTERDVLGIVAFSDNVWTVFEPTRMTQDGKDRAKAEVGKLHSLASTNLSGATFEAYSTVKAAAEKKLKDSINRAFLFTDGQPTCGETDFQRLVDIAGSKDKPQDCGLTCFGYGTDYNKELLTSMAKAGGGSAYHIQTPDECAATFGRELGGLLNCVAQNLKLTVSTKPDVKILEVVNDLDVKGNDTQTEAVIKVDDVYSQEKRRILLRIELPEMDKSGRPFKFGSAKVEYQDLLAKEPREAEISLEVEYVKESEADKDADKEVAEQIALLAAAKAQEEAMNLAQQGHFAQAQGVIRSASLGLQAVGTAFACSVANDLDQNVMHQLDASKYNVGGAHYLHSNAASYRKGRGSTLGASKLFNTQDQTDTEAAFSADDESPMAPPSIPGVFGPGALGGQPGAGFPGGFPGIANPGYPGQPSHPAQQMKKKPHQPKAGPKPLSKRRTKR